VGNALRRSHPRQASRRKVQCLSFVPTRLWSLRSTSLPYPRRPGVAHFLLREAAESCQSISGWLSASLHRSLDGTRVVNYAQAQDADSMRHIFQHLEASGFIERNKTLAQAHPGLYEVVLVLER